MSRCFPFPPPGYSAKISINETLIESIKLQRETEKAKAERKKERRREKKDKRKEKKESDKSLNAAVDEKGRDDKCETKKRKRSEEKVRKSGDKKRRREDKSPKQQSEKKTHAEEKPKLDEEKKRGVNTNELLEKSDLTQEHEQPLYSQNTYCLSDSSENSNQRKLQQATTLHENAVNAQGKQLIRIRLPSLKNQPVAVSLSTSKDEQPCSTSGRADSETGDGYDKLLPKNEEKISSDAPSGIKGVISNLNLKQTAHVVPCSSSSFEKKMKKVELVSNPNLKQTAHVVPCSSSSFEKKMKKVELVSNLNLKQTAHVVPSSSSSFEKKMKKVELVYKALVENLGPSLNEEMPDTNDEFDWLFKRSERCCKPVAAANDNSGGDERSSTMWPRAHYLAEADVYLMPFTIPF
ncbi:stress response protein NST1-like [Impatiens glandulifera]|uniref:stress response protein NST1-like n=1 Tax=Impatiens glandulifera TaxID=253017 RepID=UPI001FB0EAB4|nr:stress response protein NST1-like [Impatiens glandulifera]